VTTYFLHILRDWSDEYRHHILKHIRDAVTPGYSKLTVHDRVLTDMEASEMQVRFDIAAMTTDSGVERSECA
jgi:hypothetical protein